jgi:thiamine-phosphate pyrophosphorylase
MTADLYLVASSIGEAEGIRASLQRVLASTGAAALLLPRGVRAERPYRELVKAVIPVAQEAGCAVLIEGEPGLVRTLGADGLHVTNLDDLEEAISALKPNNIVGYAASDSRHEAMTAGELGVDYVLFGPLSGTISAEQREMARWWAETMEIASVLSDPEATAAAYDAAECEFIALSLDRVEDGA